MKTFEFEGYEINPLGVVCVTKIIDDLDGSYYFVIEPTKSKFVYYDVWLAREHREKFIDMWKEALEEL